MRNQEKVILFTDLPKTLQLIISGHPHYQNINYFIGTHSLIDFLQIYDIVLTPEMEQELFPIIFAQE